MCLFVWYTTSKGAVRNGGVKRVAWLTWSPAQWVRIIYLKVCICTSSNGNMLTRTCFPRTHVLVSSHVHSSAGLQQLMPAEVFAVFNNVVGRSWESVYRNNFCCSSSKSRFCPLEIVNSSPRIGLPWPMISQRPRWLAGVLQWFIIPITYTLTMISGGSGIECSLFAAKVCVPLAVHLWAALDRESSVTGSVEVFAQFAVSVCMHTYIYMSKVHIETMWT